MNRPRFRSSLLVAAALVLPLAGNALADNKVYRALEGDRVLVITYDAKPPYSHRIVKVKDLSPSQLERFKAMNPAAAGKMLAKRDDATEKTQAPN